MDSHDPLEDDGPLETNLRNIQPPGKATKPARAPFDLSDLWYVIKGLLAAIGILAIVVSGLSAGAGWLKEQFETPGEVAKKATDCFADAKLHPGRLAECGALAKRFEALQAGERAQQERHKAEQFCKDKGLKFKGTIGDQTECEP